MPSLLIVGKRISPSDEVSPEWLKGFEVHLRSRGCSWNTVSTYLRTFRAVYNRAVDLRKAPYVPHLFRSVYTGTRADHKRALGDEDMKKGICQVISGFCRCSVISGISGAGVIYPDVFACAVCLLSISLICVRVICVTM